MRTTPRIRYAAATAAALAIAGSTMTGAAAGQKFYADDPIWLIILKVVALFAVGVVLTLVMINAERKVVGRMQQRPGPNRVGPNGWLQSLADGLKLAFLSDIHAGSFMDGDDLRRVCERVAAEAPHVVLFGGDLINTRDRELLLYRDALRCLQPLLGTFAVPGNHDHFWGRDIGLWTSFLREHGVTVLRNRGVRLSFRRPVGSR